MPYAERHGWRLYLHPAFKDTFGSLTTEIDKLKDRDPLGFTAHPKAKLLKRITQIIQDEIPTDPGAPQYELGNTLGPAHRHWRRAKFLGRFRLFFRFQSSAKIIIYGWVNDEKTQRQAGAKTDPYVIFGQRLKRGDPPDDWAALMREVEKAASQHWERHK